MQQRAIAGGAERAVNPLPIIAARLVSAEHLAEDLVPGLKLVARAHLDDLPRSA